MHTEHNGRPSAHGPTRDKLVAGIHASLHGIDASQIPLTGIHCHVHVGDVMAVLSVWPWDLSKPPLQPGEHPFQVIRVPNSPSPPQAQPTIPIVSPPTSASSHAADDALPGWLIDIERAVYEAATSSPQSVARLATLAGYSVSRVREAVARLVGCEPPLLVRVRGGIKRVTRNRA